MEYQHFVPQVYLRNFCKDSQEGFLFGTNFIEKARRWTTPKEYHVGSVCGDDDFYNLTEDVAKLKNVPENVIEKSAFMYERFFITGITKKINNQTITTEDLGKLCHFYISMKQRNPMFRNGYTIDRIKKSMPNTFDSVRKNVMQKFKDKTIEEINVEIEKSAKSIQENPNVSKLIHTHSLLSNMQKPSDVTLNVFNKLLQYDILIYLIEEEKLYFIVTDNPGYSVDLTGVVHNTKFIEDKYHLIPLSSKIAIIFHKPENESDNYKNIKWVKLDSAKVDSINLCSAKWRNQYLYCENREYLLQFTRKNGINDVKQ